jgi:DNA-binding response OmpR family regulator
MPLKRHILYVEDHEDTRDLIVMVLMQRGYEVTSSTTIEDGVKLAARNKYDLYLLDSRLPDGSGLDLCQRIREFDDTTPIVFYSAAAYEVDREKALGCGAQGYIVKPAVNSELCDMVSAVIEGKSLEPAAPGNGHRT